jgi:hypothetical protein
MARRHRGTRKTRRAGGIMKTVNKTMKVTKGMATKTVGMLQRLAVGTVRAVGRTGAVISMQAKKTLRRVRGRKATRRHR